MEFTEAIPAFGGKAVLSPNGRYLARLTPTHDFILLIQETKSLSVVLSTAVPLLMDNEAAAGMPKSRHFPPPKPRRILPQDISLSWAPDSSKIMIVDGPVNRVFVYDRTGKDEVGSILQETLPTSRFLWAPDSEHIVSLLYHRIGLRVWSLDSRYPIKSITNIKSSTAGISFCQEGNMMALLHRKDGADFIAIYNCRTWEPVQVLSPPESAMLEELMFASGDFSRNHIADRPLLFAWELACLSSRLFIFEPDGSCKVVDASCGLENSQASVGFSAFVPSPSSNMGAFLGDDGSICLWNMLLHKPVAQVLLTSELTRIPHLIVFRERVVYGEEAKFVKYESGYDLMLNELQGKPSLQQSSATIRAKFSHDSKNMAIHSSKFPNHLWIYSVPELTFIAVLCQLPTAGGIKSFDWHSEETILGLVTGSDYVYFWQHEGCHCIPQPYTEQDECCTRSVEWGSHEKGLMLLSGTNACCLAVQDFSS